MGSPSELEYLKGLVAQLNEKIRTLEEREKRAVRGPKTPAQQLRTILIGPPGAGACPATLARSLLREVLWHLKY